MIREIRQRVREWPSSIGLIWMVTAVLGTAGAQTRPEGAEAEPPAELEEAADVALVFGGKPTTRGVVESRLSPPVRAALDRWAPMAETFGLEIVLGEKPGHIVLGHAPTPRLVEAAKWLDRAYDLLDPLVPPGEGREMKATVAILIDEEGVAGGAWGSVVSVLAAEKLIPRAAADHLQSSVEGLTLRQVPLFLQPTFDVAGDASAGDDEFRLGNEVVHKGAQCLLTMRAGQQPPALLWGLGYVAEIKLFGSVYQFDQAGFVSVDDHKGWNGDAREALEEHRSGSFSLAEVAVDAAAGRPDPAQKLTWAGLAYLSQKQPQQLAALWGELARAQAEADPTGTYPGWRGDRARTLEILRGTLDTIDASELSSFLKRGR